MNQRFCNGMVHVIKQGDNLYQLSRMYRVPLALILRANPYVDVYNLQIGQEICIPVARPFPGMMNPGRPQVMNPQEISPQPSVSEMGDRNNQNNCSDCEDRNDCDDCDDCDDRNDRNDRNERMDMQSQEEKNVFVCDGTKSLGEILRMEGITMEEFVEMNELDRVILAADVQLQLSKKV